MTSVTFDTVKNTINERSAALDKEWKRLDKFDDVIETKREILRQCKININDIEHTYQKIHNNMPSVLVEDGLNFIEPFIEDAILTDAAKRLYADIKMLSNPYHRSVAGEMLDRFIVRYCDFRHYVRKLNSACDEINKIYYYIR
jgi:hypothetical protein